MSNFEQGQPLYHECVPTAFQVVAGAAGFVDTDVSAIVSYARRAYFLNYAANNQDCGCRKDGSAVNTSRDVTPGVLQYVGCCEVSGGIVELYRDVAADNNYYLIGWDA